MRRHPALIAFLFCAPLAAACAPDPFVTSAPTLQLSERGQVAVGICYNAEGTTREKIYALAEKECERVMTLDKQAFDRIELWKHDTVFNGCPILAKARVSFICQPPNAK